MADTFSKQQRSQIMAKVKGRDTKPEIFVRKFLFSNGFRYRKNSKQLPGKPDIVLPKYKTVIFVHGCFWHGHLGCSAASLPKTRLEYWEPKIAKNGSRDKRKKKELQKLGWKVVTIWECQLKNKSKSQNTFKRLLKFLNSRLIK